VLQPAWALGGKYLFVNTATTGIMNIVMPMNI